MARMVDRELSTLAFHARVLAEAADPANPLLERANFLGIAAAGLQEFICVRLGSLTARLRRGDDLRPSGMTASQTLEEAWKRTDILTMRLDRILHEQILPALAEKGVRITQSDDVTPVQMAALSTVFIRDMMPRLEPVILDDDTDMPLLQSGQAALAVLLQETESAREQLAIVQLPETLPGLVHLAGKGHWLMVEDAVKLNLHQVFGERKIKACYPFKVLRAGHAACKASETDVRKAVRDCMAKRAKGKILRVVCSPEMPGLMEEALCAALKVDRSLAVRRGYVLDHARVMRSLLQLPGMETMRYEPYEGWVAPELTGDLFAAIRRKDHLLCHPYDSFEPVLSLLEQAAGDRYVQEIHMTLYRISAQSRVLEALKQAAHHGIQVHVCVEPRARMDEERNLQLMDTLEKAGCRVYTGVRGVKVHGKALMIVRAEEEGVRYYVHLGTGNYNETTARHYTDVGLLTADAAVGADAARFFQCLEGQREQPDLEFLTASPQGMRQELMRLIRREMEKASRGEDCGIACMLNALTDVEMINLLTEASRCGVKVNLTVRGACCIAPGVDRDTANITVQSVVGRYLEHSRVFAFGARGQEEVYFSSADWMKRSLNRRLELLVPVKDPACRKKLLHCMALRQEKDVHAWQMQGEEYALPACAEGASLRDVQKLLMQDATNGWANA